MDDQLLDTYKHAITRRHLLSSGSNGPGSAAGKAIDSNNDGTFASCSCTLEQTDPLWEIDLGAVNSIDHILVYNRNDCCPERLQNGIIS